MKRLYSIIFVTLAFAGFAHAGECAFSDSTNKDITVLSNDLGPLVGNLSVNGHTYRTIRTATAERGKQCFEFDVTRTLHVKAWLITADSTALPYTPVTRREYLVQARMELKSIARYTITTHLIDSLLQNSTPQQLSQPAVVSVKAGDFKGFEDGQPNTTTLVRLDPAPKCLLICWRYNPANLHDPSPALPPL
jgi:hypothetical protein